MTDEMIFPAKPQSLSRQLLAWYDTAHRDLPWRPQPGELGNPYHVWLSEVMLQQTTVAAVIPYFLKFTERWATLAELAAAEDAEVMAAWAGLGYYSRARNLLKCARQVMGGHGGAFPQTMAEIRKLAGCGPYTSGAIAAIAFGQPVAAVDGNVERVLTRLLDDATPLPQFKRKAHDIAQGLVPSDRPGDFVQASIELGALVCRPRDPKCGDCPWRDVCRSRAAGTVLERPNRPSKAAKPQRYGVAYWVERDNQVWLVRRPDKGLLGGMLAVPCSEWRENDGSLSPVPPQGADGWNVSVQNASVRHVFTHFALDMTVVKLEPPNGSDISTVVGEGEWCPAADVLDAGLPTVFKKVAKVFVKTKK